MSMHAEGMSNGQSSGVLLKEVAAFQRCPLIEASLYYTEALPLIHTPSIMFSTFFADYKLQDPKRFPSDLSP